MKENGSTIRKMERASISIKREKRDMKEDGRMGLLMIRESSSIKMAPLMKVNGRMVEDMEEGF